MKFFITLLFIFASICTQCQDLDNLDRKMGFNKFKLESSFDIYKANLKLNDIDDKVKFYDYTGSDVSSVFGISYDKITLGFYNNKLYTISITFLYTTERDDAILQNKLKELFGFTKTSNDVKTPSGAEYEWAMQWESKKVLLQVEKYNISSKTSPPWLTEIFMYSKKMRSEILNDSF